MRHYTLYNIVALTCIMLLVGGKAWGQTYIINPQTGKTFPQEDVPTYVDTVYVENNVSRELTIPDNQDYYYVRWYRKNADGNGTTVDRLSSRLNSTSTAPSFFWFVGRNNSNSRGGVTYTATNQEDAVYCDLSFNTDGLEFKPDGRTFTEPTIGKRYMFYIKPANDMRERLNALKDGEALQTIRMTVPKGATNVNLQMDLAPSSYYWDTNYQGESFQFRINGSNYTSNRKLIELKEFGAINNETTVEVFARTNRTNSPCLARFILTPQDNSSFKTAAQIVGDEGRNPDKDEDKYAQVGEVNFDYDGTVATLTKDNNMGKEPIPSSRTTYSFMNPMLPWVVSPGRIMPEDAYGLFRSANVPEISVMGEDYGPSWARSYDPSSEQGSQGNNKTYAWYYSRIRGISDRIVYDRTYYNSNRSLHGSFFYVNASAQAGRVVTVPIEGKLCANTELTVTAWVADITDVETPPNVNLLLRGVDSEGNSEGNSEVLHRFTSGDMVRSSDNDRANWKQLCYKIRLNSDVNLYDKFEVEFQNNAPNSGGADYAIDDIRIYKTLPSISVRRESACDYSTLIVSSDYNTLMRNMGWSDDPNVLANVDLTKPEVRKYRYGIMGNDPYTSDPHEHVGNMYYSITEKNLDDPAVTGGSGFDDWVTLNKSLLQKGEQLGDNTLKNLSKSMRVAIPTDLNLPVEGSPGHGQVPEDKETAAMDEITMNLRALNDFLSDTEAKDIYDQDGNKVETKTIWSAAELATAGINPTELKAYLENVATITSESDKITGKITTTQEQVENILKNPTAYALYEEWLLKVFDFLQLPRIRCPWLKENVAGDKILCLSEIDVTNTDLKYKGEIGPDGGPAASGEYHVVVFNAEHVIHGGTVNFSDDCLLHSPFTVQPSSTFAINTDMTSDGKGCLGAITSIQGSLLVDEVDEYGNIISKEPIPFENAYGEDGLYTFDWFIGTKDDYDEYTYQITSSNYDIRGIIKAFRDSQTDKTNHFTKEDVLNSSFYENEYTKEDADLLISLLGDAENEAKLVIGNLKEKVKIRWPECVVALPYVPEIKNGEEGAEGKTYSFCVEPHEIPLEAHTSPTLSVGFSGTASDIDVVPLRLGLRNINDASGNGVLLSGIPIQASSVTFGSEGNSLGKPYGNDNSTTVYLNDYNSPDLISVATLDNLLATKNAEGTLSIQFNDNVTQYFKEGQDQYRLYIPFGEYSDENAETEIEGSCGGYAELTLKIVPEYLTWQKDNAEVWHNDTHWHQSTKAELYKDDQSETDANGSDPIENAFSPLYFTKITIPEDKQLALSNEVTGDIQYDMAVNIDENGALKVDKYYTNKVSEIYFKPGATLMNQHLLTCGKAWVEFEIKNDEKRWMASPLQGVYAGDIYAPAENGKQETEAFKDIKYNENGSTDYSRWSPAFYQKAWDRAVEYATTTDGSSMTSAKMLKSNWSIEYNDVTVPYSIGKGFYLSVKNVSMDESKGADGTAIVRLPKADSDYLYEEAPTTKAATVPTRTNPGELANLEILKQEDGYYSFQLSEENVYGDGDHFLVGNPYMTYLNMEEFLKTNENVLNPKYWTLKDGLIEANVGTPDVDWGTGETAGFIPPMTAFFVERKDYGVTTTAEGEEETPAPETLEVKFTTAMMADKETAETKPATRLISASAPVLTLTAERNGKKGRSVISLRDKADNGYQPQEDAVALLDSELDAPVAYSVAGSKAAQVNAVKSIDNIPLGVYSDSKGEVTLTIEGLGQFAEPLSLYDVQARKSMELTGDSHTIRLDGSSHGRYFLRSGSATGNEVVGGGMSISIYSVVAGKVIVSSTQEIRNIKVYSLSGTMVKNYMNLNTAQYTFNLPAGVYVVHAEGKDDTVKVEKVMVR